MSFIKWLDKNFEYCCLAALLIVMTVLSFTNVILRYCFKSPIGWSDEVCCYCLALSAFICLPCSIRYRTAIRVDTLVSILPKGVQKVLALICDVIILAFLGICVKGGIGIVQNAAQVGQRSPATQWPVSVLYAIMTAFYCLAIFRTLQAMYLDLTGKRESAAPAPAEKED